MRLRLLPWTWEWVEAPQQLNRGTDGDFERKFNAMVSTLHADVSVAARVKYFCVLHSLGSELISRPLKIHDGPSPVERGHYSFVRQMFRIPPKPPHARDRIEGKGIGGRDYDDPAFEERAYVRRTHPDQDSDHTSNCSSPSPTLL